MLQIICNNSVSTQIITNIFYHLSIILLILHITIKMLEKKNRFFPLKKLEPTVKADGCFRFSSLVCFYRCESRSRQGVTIISGDLWTDNVYDYGAINDL